MVFKIPFLLLHEEERVNMEAALSIVERPSFIPVGSELAANLASDETQYILSYEHACYDSDKGPTFLATKGVFTCISVFAWSPSKKAFAAHIPLNQVHYNIRHGKVENTLPEITKALTRTFKHEDPTTVKVHIVGGQKEQDANHDLALLFKSPLMHRFSWHVIMAIRAAGLTVNGNSTHLLNVFEGIPYNILFEQQQRAKGHSFSLVALDRNTGALITHTLVESVGDYRIAALGVRDMAECVRYSEAFKLPWAVQGRSSVRVFSVDV
jgi:hypothetical protein